jgi:hypothetical protein
MAKKLTPEARYQAVGQLMAEMPDFGPSGKQAIQTDVMARAKATMWLGRAVALFEEAGNIGDASALQVISDRLLEYGGFDRTHQTVSSVTSRALARAELAAPAEMHGMFIAAGNTFDALVGMGNLLSRASSDVLFVDPYANHTMLHEFGKLAKEGVSIRVLARSQQREDLISAAGRWTNQYGARRPLEVKLLPKRHLHDRLIFIDGKEAWISGQSFKDLAERAHTVIMRAWPELEPDKIEAFSELWEEAEPLSESPPRARLGGQ